MKDWLVLISRVGFSGKGRGSNAGGGVMGQYMEEGGWTYLDGLEEAQQVERIGQRIMELGGMRATVFDHLTVKHQLNVDISSSETRARAGQAHQRCEP